ncbi:MAG: ribosome silencing factor [Bacteroidales bacterium]|nr:ribosome silencing factor [Bacteroidales bacterium]MCB9013368.1 ribosome silencing factor [Bacteroidales bacterium]
MKKNTNITDEKLVESIIESIKDKKGKKIVSIDLRGIGNSLFDFFIICHGTSTTNVSAISDNVEIKAKENFGIKPNHVEGTQNSQWVLIDFTGVVVHVFLEEQRAFYRLEDLWADGKVRIFEDE